MVANSLTELACEHRCWGPPFMVRRQMWPLSVSSQMFDLKYLSWNLKTVLIHPGPNLFSFRINSYKNWWDRHSCSCANYCFPMPFLFPLVLFCNSQCRVWWAQDPCLKDGSKCEAAPSLACWAGSGDWIALLLILWMLSTTRIFLGRALLFLLETSSFGLHCFLSLERP